jgi:hypothetical protein
VTDTQACGAIFLGLLAVVYVMASLFAAVGSPTPKWAYAGILIAIVTAGLFTAIVMYCIFDFVRWLI